MNSEKENLGESKTQVQRLLNSMSRPRRVTRQGVVSIRDGILSYLALKQTYIFYFRIPNETIDRSFTLSHSDRNRRQTRVRTQRTFVQRIQGICSHEKLPQKFLSSSKTRLWEIP